MFRFMMQKLRHKKWLVICLLIGNILLVAVAAGYPMYKNASLQRMLSDEFDSYAEKNGVHPGLITMSASAQKGSFKQEFLELEEYSTRVSGEMGVELIERVSHLSLSLAGSESTMERDGASQKIRIGSLSSLEEHITVLSGTMYAKECGEDGVLEAVVTEATLIGKNLLVDEELVFSSVKDADGKPLHIRIVGVIKNSATDDEYWVKGPDAYDDEVLIDQDLFMELFRGDNMNRYNINGTWYVLSDCDTLRQEDALQAKERIDSLLELRGVGKVITCDGYEQVLDEFVGKEKKINATLMILQVPVLALLAAFLFMISGQMLSMEQSEISLLKSRGAGKGQIIRLYFMQNLLLAALAFIVGIPLGIYLCKLIGSSTAFLEFGVRRALPVELNGEVFAYAGVAIAASVLLTLIPVIKYSGVSIVNVKRKKARS